MNLVIIDYGAGNIKSLEFAFKRLGITACLSNNSEQIMKADQVIFPGVGEASSAMKMLKKNKLDGVIPALEQPVLGICLGMQLLCKSSEEGNTPGLGVFDVEVKQFTNQLKVPQIGWNRVGRLRSKLFKGIQEGEFMYTVNSYYAELGPETIAVSDYGLNYSAALQKGNFYGTQFHPEKSSKAGEQILKNFLKL